ncbi:MAG: sulfite exporter TauE/SafE family protein [Salinisphaera sp.]|uniref:sulfite exporter TauE/SafE family protein n=1 Tax=Salinisphaera sp. TaxID=1914330 RepID=UPI003C7C32C4
MQILLFNLAALAGAVSQGLTGFGSGTLMVSSLVLIYPFRDVVPVVAVVALGTNLVMMLLARREFDWRRGPIAALSLSAGVLGGAQLLAALPVDILQRTLGAVILCYVALNLFKTPAPQRMPAMGWADASGLAGSSVFAGVIVGAVGVSPIPLLIYVNMRYPKRYSRSILTMAFLLSSAVQALIYTHLGLLTTHSWWLALATLPALLIGLIAGHKLHYRVDQKTFSRILALVLALPALRLVIG